MLRLYILSGDMKAALRTKARKLVEDGSGVTAIEYGLIAAAIALAIAGVVVFLGEDITNLFERTRNELKPKGGTP